MVQSIAWIAGNCVMPLIYWMVRDWIWFILITTLPGLIFFFFPQYMIESPRWLVNKGKLKRCANELNKIAKINQIDVKITEEYLAEKLPKHDKESVYGLMSLFSSWRLAKNTVLILISLIIGVLSYFILVLNSTRMDGNPHSNFVWQSLIELPASFVGKWLGDKIGRRLTNSLSLILSTITSFLIVFFVTDIENEFFTKTLAIIMKFFITIVIYIINLQSMETFPTCLRQTGIALGSLTVNIFGIVGPYVVYLGTNVDVRYPYLIIGGLTSFSFLSSLFLPETLHQKLPDTLADAHEFGAKQKFWYIPRASKSDDSIPEEEGMLNETKK